jgi:uncharacterized membrane protein HdeD (DUF308 family)
MQKLMSSKTRGSMLWGFLLVILGLFAMMTPAVSGIATTFMLGALLLISGLATVIYAFGSHAYHVWSLPGVGLMER